MGNGFKGTYAVGVYDPIGSRDYATWFDLWNETDANNKSDSTTIGRAPVDPSINVPLTGTGSPVAYVIGREIVSTPAVLSYGNLTPIMKTDTVTTTTKEDVNVWHGYPETVTVTTTTSVDTTYIEGYSMDIVMGICLGPDVKLVGLFYNNQKVWSGSLGPSRGIITLPQGLGAISGAQMIFNGGAIDQAVDPVLASTTDQNAYVGIAYVIIRHIRADLPLENMFFEVERFPNPLGLTTAQNRMVDDINPMSAMADIITNEWGGAGLNISTINVANFKTRAATLFSEGNSCSISENNASSVLTMLGLLLSQTRGIMYQNPGSGQLEINFMRKNFTLTVQNNLGQSDLKSIRDFNKTNWSNTLSKLFGNYTSRDSGYTPDSVFASNPSLNDKSKAGERNYGFVHSKQVCMNLLARDLSQSSAPLFTISFEATRKAADLLPGDVVTVSWAPYELYGVPVIIQKVRNLPTDQNTVVIEGAQHSIPNVSPVFEVPGTPYDPGISFAPAAPPALRIATAPYWIARASGKVSSAIDSNVISGIMLPTPANSIQAAFDAYSQYTNSGDKSSQIRYIQDGNYPTYAETTTLIDKYDGWLTGKIASLIVSNVINPVNMVSPGSDGVRNGKILAFINDEIISFETATLTGASEYTLTNVCRALLDTVAREHPVGSKLHIINNNYRNVIDGLFNYPLLKLPDFDVVSHTAAINGSRSIASQWKAFPAAWAAGNSRTLSPPRPHDTKLNGTRNTTLVEIVVGTDVTLSWKTRSRVSMAVALQTDAAEISEVSLTGKYQTHSVVLVDGNGTETVLGTTLDDANYNSLTVTVPATGVLLGDSFIYVRSNLVLSFGTLSSIYKDTLPVRLLTNSMYISEDGANFFISEDDNSLYVQE